MKNKTFNDIKFKNHPNGYGILGTLVVNDFTVSVIAGPGFYSFPKQDFKSPDKYEAFEVAVMDQDGKFITQDFFPDYENDVLGWLSRDDINHLISKLETQKAWIPEV
jgi:hypothetical protein